ncbi:MAG TPA: hypothetical protein VHO69_02790 [Phototrophicaceae bacterium]|nr:hypothetical protein [Phototrophicaceae bacterium]
MAEQPAEVTAPEAGFAPPRERRIFRRIGCLAGLLLWALIMLLPCFLFFLATQEQITISLGDAPQQTARIWLVNEIRQRGLGLSWASVKPGTSDRTVCVQTETRFMLWVGTGPAATHCECYTRVNAAWQPTESYNGSCAP